jgi:hypothetical protein
VVSDFIGEEAQEWYAKLMSVTGSVTVSQEGDVEERLGGFVDVHLEGKSGVEIGVCWSVANANEDVAEVMS